jgi:hypothetical protein
MVPVALSAVPTEGRRVAHISAAGLKRIRRPVQKLEQLGQELVLALPSSISDLD